MFDLGQQGRSVTYLNFRNTQDDTDLQTCVSTQEFNYSNFIDNSGDYLIAIERLKVPIHRIPMVPALAPAYTLIPNAGGAVVRTTDDAYSIKEFVDQLNNVTPGLVFKIDTKGGLSFNYTGFADNSIQLSETLAQIMDLKTNITAADSVGGYVAAGSSAFDRFDQLDKVQIEARGLNVAQEIVNTDTTLPILTDIIVPSTYSVNYSEPTGVNVASDLEVNVTYATRQNVLYGGDVERRFINLVGNLAVQNITIQAVAIFRDGSRNRISLPRGSSFECKLGFYRK